MASYRIRSVEIAGEPLAGATGRLEVIEAGPDRRGEWSASVELNGMPPAATRGEGELDVRVTTTEGRTFTGRAFVDASISAGATVSATLRVLGTGDFELV